MHSLIDSNNYFIWLISFECWVGLISKNQSGEYYLLLMHAFCSAAIVTQIKSGPHNKEYIYIYHSKVFLKYEWLFSLIYSYLYEKFIIWINHLYLVQNEFKIASIISHLTVVFFFSYFFFFHFCMYASLEQIRWFRKPVDFNVD